MKLADALRRTETRTIRDPTDVEALRRHLKDLII